MAKTPIAKKEKADAEKKALKVKKTTLRILIFVCLF